MLRVLQVDNSEAEVTFLRKVLSDNGIEVEFVRANHRSEPGGAPERPALELEQQIERMAAQNEGMARLIEELEERVRDRTAKLEAANQELEAFSYAVSHDLAAPLRHIGAFAEMLKEACADKLDQTGREYVARICAGTQTMKELTHGLFELSKVSRVELTRQKVSLSAMAQDIVSRLAASDPERKVEWQIGGGVEAEGDPVLLRVVMENLLSNAWKYTMKCPSARITFGASPQADGSPAYVVRDNGAGFSMEWADRLFQPFRRLHSQHEFPGSGIGLATVQRIVRRHGGRIWAEGAVGQGATFRFTLGGG
jgi:hypothetical protein